MKKTYIQPAISAYRLTSAAIMAGSVNGTNVDGLDNGGDTSTSGITTAGSRGSIWDDEE